MSMALSGPFRSRNLLRLLSRRHGRRTRQRKAVCCTCSVRPQAHFFYYWAADTVETAPIHCICMQSLGTTLPWLGMEKAYHSWELVTWNFWVSNSVPNLLLLSCPSFEENDSCSWMSRNLYTYILDVHGTPFVRAQWFGSEGRVK